MRILLSAYACSPDGVSEAGNGWGWATHLAARGLEVHVLTAQRHRQAIEKELGERPLDNLTFTFVEPHLPGVPTSIGGRHYFAWQWVAVDEAKALHEAKRFDVVHHVTYGSVHVPTLLWKLGVPTVFGPVGGGQTAPAAMLPYFAGARRSERFRTFLTRAVGLSPLHRWWLGRMSYILTANEETRALVAKLGRSDALISMDAGLPVDFYAASPRQFQRSNTLRLLWAGRLLPRKALPLALDALQAAKVPLTLTIAGGGLSPSTMVEMIEARGLREKVTWIGKVSWAEMRECYRTHDAFLFTSLRDSCGVQLLEAMALALPVITLDHQGGALLVPEGAGFKVPVSDPYTTVKTLALTLDRFSALSVLERNHMSKVAWERALNFAWPTRAKEIHQLYESLSKLVPVPIDRDSMR